MQKVDVTVVAAADAHETARLVQYVKQGLRKNIPPLLKPCHDQVKVMVDQPGHAHVLCETCGRQLGGVYWQRPNVWASGSIYFSPAA